ncbi:MAG: hypothetical protein FJ148_25235, partial [Deltaproteobacteria bacterium]|nr:hypothetical protein [Deltaproteobacteria bacterium]
MPRPSTRPAIAPEYAQPASAPRSPRHHASEALLDAISTIPLCRTLPRVPPAGRLWRGSARARKSPTRFARGRARANRGPGADRCNGLRPGRRPMQRLAARAPTDATACGPGVPQGGESRNRRSTAGPGERMRGPVGGQSQPDPGTPGGRGIVHGILVQLVVPAVIGTGTGACVAGASWLVEGQAVRELALLPGALPALPSLVALLATLLIVRFVTRVDRPATAEVYIEVFHHRGSRIALRELPGRVLAAAATVSGGGSQGLESPSALLGAALGQVLGDRLPRLGAYERRTWTIAGASAGIAAVFSSPAVGAMYGIEVPFRRDADLPRLVPAAVAAGASYLTRAALVGPSHLVVLSGVPRLDAGFALACALVAVGCGGGAWLFARATDLLRGLGRSAGAVPRAAIGGAALAA